MMGRKRRDQEGCGESICLGWHRNAPTTSSRGRWSLGTGAYCFISGVDRPRVPALISAAKTDRGPGFRAQNQIDAAKFPTDPNREVSRRSSEFPRRYQG
jgi:hypothetical protein